VRRLILEGDQFLFLMVMASFGLTTALARLREAGGAWRLIGVGLVAIVVSAGTAYGLVSLAGLNASAGASQRAAPAQAGAAAGSGPTEGGDGARLFSAVGCEKCHVRSLQGSAGDVLLYSDLLLHDMGPHSTTRSSRETPPELPGARHRSSAWVCDSDFCTMDGPRHCAPRSLTTAAKAASFVIGSSNLRMSISRRSFGSCRPCECLRWPWTASARPKPCDRSA
jgi:hypothetical protein